MPEGPNKRPREDLEVAAEGMTGAEVVGELPAPEQAAGDAMVTETAHPGRAPETLSAAPAARLPGTADTSGSLSLSVDSEGCVSSCHNADGFCFRMPRGKRRHGFPGANQTGEA